MRQVLAGLAVIVISAASATLGAQHWPQFRGTMAGVGVDHPNLPETWSTTENVDGWSTSQGSAGAHRSLG